MTAATIASPQPSPSSSPPSSPPRPADGQTEDSRANNNNNNSPDASDDDNMAVAAEMATPGTATADTTDTTDTATTTTAAPGAVASCRCPRCGAAVDHPVPAPAAPGDDTEALLRQAREQIVALELQVSHLDQKAAAAIDRWAGYEDELTQLRRQLAAARGGSPTIGGPPAPARSASVSAAAAAAAPVTPVSPTMRMSFLPTGAASRISALLSARTAKSTPNLKEAAAAQLYASSSSSPPMPSMPAMPPMTPAMLTPPPSATNVGYEYNMQSPASATMSPPPPPPPRTPLGLSFFGGSMQQTPAVIREEKEEEELQQKQLPPPPMSPSTKELMEALTREQKLRRAAEGRLDNTSREVEELSVSLFEQANEMVAEERRARARLEARVAVLEQRDSEKKARLERLEQAMQRIERLRAMLGMDAVPVPVPAAKTVPAAGRASLPMAMIKRLAV